jgi:hypothetical protein
MYVSKMYVCLEKKTNENFLFFSIVIECRCWRQNGLCVRRRKKYLSKESKSCNETTAIDDKSIGNSVSSAVWLTVFYYGNTWVNFRSRQYIYIISSLWFLFLKTSHKIIFCINSKVLLKELISSLIELI